MSNVERDKRNTIVLQELGCRVLAVIGGCGANMAKTKYDLPWVDEVEILDITIDD